jgi:hypothetical protein
MKSILLIAALAFFSLSSFGMTCKSSESGFTYKLSIEERSLEVIDTDGKTTFFTDLLYPHEVDGVLMLMIPNGMDVAATVEMVKGKKVVTIFGEENLNCND